MGAKIPPQPPWVWGPSEVNAWIRDAFPSKAERPRRRASRRAPTVRRVRVRILEAPPERVRAALVDGLAAIGYGAATGSPHRVTAEKRGHRALATIHRSVLWRGVVVSIRFDPPVRRFSSRHLLRLFTERFRVVGVSSGAW